MRYLKSLWLVTLILYCLSACITNFLYANKTSVKIECPELADKGTEITIKITAIHDGNNFLHHTKSLYVYKDGKEIAKWMFSAFSRPENETFTREIKFIINEPMEISADGYCNIHGSNGKEIRIINLKK